MSFAQSLCFPNIRFLPKAWKWLISIEGKNLKKHVRGMHYIVPSLFESDRGAIASETMFSCKRGFVPEINYPSIEATLTGEDFLAFWTRDRLSIGP